jgi:protein phosphatase
MLLAKNPTMDRARLASHPMRHVLVNVLGARDEVDVQVGECALADGDLLLACSDGLHGSLDDDELRGLLACGGDLDALARALVRAACDKGGPDNITALLVRCGARP